MSLFPVTYWTGIWDPTREGISWEVDWLRCALSPGSPVVAFTPQRSTALLPQRVLRLNFERWLALRVAAAVLEPTGRITHIFGGIGTVGHFLHVLGRRPIVMTAVIGGASLPSSVLEKISRFVVETPALRRRLIASGVDAGRIELIYPAVNVRSYSVGQPSPSERFRIVFASTPDNSMEMSVRGIHLLIELARIRPDIEIYVPWRQWGDLEAAKRALSATNPPSNFVVDHAHVADMRAVFSSAHATVCAFDENIGKSAPNSIIEGLAAGRPALLTDTCDLADLVGDWQAGVVTERTVTGLAAGVDDLRSRYELASVRARRLAESEFDHTSALAKYRRIYESL